MLLEVDSVLSGDGLTNGLMAIYKLWLFARLIKLFVTALKEVALNELCFN